MNAQTTTPKTLQDAIKYFADYSNAHAFMVQIRWPGGEVCCPQCGSTRVRYIKTRRQWECREQHAKRRFSLKTGTLMEESPLPLEKWLAALWVEVNCKNSISSYEVARDLGITQKSAWFMLHRLRKALHIGSFDKLFGEVESDESYIGGLAKNMHARKRKALGITAGVGVGKAVIHGMLQRGTDKVHSKVKATLVADARLTSLLPILTKSVAKGTTLYTDSAPVYANQNITESFVHSAIDHSRAYVQGRCHTNGLENFWSLFKRCIRGTHVNVEPFHIQAYVDSEVFRFNNREVKDGDRFALALRGLPGKRLTYKALIGASEEYTGGSSAASGGERK